MSASAISFINHQAIVCVPKALQAVTRDCSYSYFLRVDSNIACSVVMSCCQVTLESLNLVDYPSIPVFRLAKRAVWFLLAKYSSKLEHSATKRNMKCDEVLKEQLDSYT